MSGYSPTKFKSFYIILFLFIITGFSAINAQYSITGPTNVEQGQTYTYSVTPGSNLSYIYWWSPSGGDASYNSPPSATVTWTGLGSGTVEAVIYDYYSNVFTEDLTVTITTSGPAIPTMATITNYPGYTRLTRGTPPSGETWYWQDSSSGTSTSNSALYVDRPFGTTQYFLKSYKSSTSQWGNALTINYTVDPDPNGLSNENYIHTITPRIETTDISGLTENEKIESVTYFDGLGRPMQDVSKHAGGNGEDIITHIGYDAFGRQEKDYLPYTSTTGSGSYRASALSSTNSFYDTAKYEPDFPGMTTSTINPYSEKLFEASPLNRVLKQAAPGASWKLGTGHEIKFDYKTNVAGEVKLYKTTAILNATSGLYNTSLVNGAGTVFYGANQLYKTITYDENSAAIPTETNGATVEFKNKQGQVVLKRTYNAGVNHDTYYVYDDYGNLTYVIPPKADTSITTTILNELCYQYKYDSRNRLAEKKVPGKQWEFIVYDNLDRPIATGPAFSPFTSPTENGWSITKYDAFDRPVISAWMPANVTSAGRKALQDARNAELTKFSETKITTTANTTINGIAFRYTNVVFPTSGYHVLTVNYYDDYNFPNAPTIPGTIEGQTVYYNNTVKPKGLPTGSWTRILETSTLYKNETAYSLYDSKARPIRSYTKNYLGGYTYVDSKLDFTGKPEYTITKHKLLSTSAELTTKEEFTYTDQGRLLTQTHQINGGTKQLIAKNDYDELGQLTSKKVGGTDITGATGLQTVDYAYNVRGWLKQINNPASLGTDLFGFKINYNTVSHGATPLYNGNISETEWKTQNDNVFRWYKYGYDKLNRITSATAYSSNYNVSGIGYDKNGNIMNLTRRGHTNIGGTTFGVMDQLTYTYPTNSNKLTIVSDAGNDSFGFKDDQIGTGTDITTDYTYDANGNLKTDANKGITAIAYNHLNLPTSVTLAGGTISYIYDATGVKQRKVAAGTTTEYAGNYLYQGGTLQFFNHPEGYIENSAGTYKYHYQYKDHLGNVRLSYTNSGSAGSPNVVISEENNYYPFGLEHKGYNNVVYGTENQWKYQGKEHEQEFGLNTYDFGARNYMPDLGRWKTVDPLAEEFNRFSPYSSMMNNPINYIDPDGRAAIRPDNDYGLDKETGKLTLIKETNDDFDEIFTGEFEQDDSFTKDGESLKIEKGALFGEKGQDISKEGVIFRNLQDGLKATKFMSFSSEKEMNAWGYENSAGSQGLFLNPWQNSTDRSSKDLLLQTGDRVGLLGSLGKKVFKIHTHPGTSQGLGYGYPSVRRDKNNKIISGDLSTIRYNKNYPHYLLSRRDGVTRYFPSGTTYSVKDLDKYF